MLNESQPTQLRGSLACSGHSPDVSSLPTFYFLVPDWFLLQKSLVWKAEGCSPSAGMFIFFLSPNFEEKSGLAHPGSLKMFASVVWWLASDQILEAQRNPRLLPSTNRYQHTHTGKCLPLSTSKTQAPHPCFHCMQWCGWEKYKESVQKRTWKGTTGTWLRTGQSDHFLHLALGRAQRCASRATELQFCDFLGTTDRNTFFFFLL